MKRIRHLSKPPEIVMLRLASTLILVVLLAALTAQLPATPTSAQEPAKDKEKRKEKGKDAAPTEPKDDDVGRVTLAFDPGSHTQPIMALGFNKDQSKLISVGMDYSIQVWSTATGERLDILRLPPYGRDNGYDTNRWEAAAISPDGNFVAVGGHPKKFWDDSNAITRLLIVDLSTRRVRKVVIALGGKTAITSLCFSADGDRLAVGTGGEQNTAYIIDDVIRLMRTAADGKRPSLPKLVGKDFLGDVTNVALSPSGNRLLVSTKRDQVSSWNVAGKSKEGWTELGEFRANTTDTFAWSPDETQFARAWHAGPTKGSQGIEVRDAAGKQIKNWTTKDLTPGFQRVSTCTTFRYLAADSLFVTAFSKLGNSDGKGTVAVMLDPTTGKTTRRYTDTTGEGRFAPCGAVSGTGELAAATASLNLDAVVYRLADGKVVARCGSRAPYPTAVAWSNDPKAPAVAWSGNPELHRSNSKLDDLQYAFDLAKMEPATIHPKDFGFRRMTLGEWTLTGRDRTGGPLGVVTLKKGNEVAKRPFGTGVMAATMIPNGDQPPLLAYSQQNEKSPLGSEAFLTDIEGKKLVAWQPRTTQHGDMVSSPDGRYVLTNTGTHRMSIYRTDKSTFPFLNIVRVNGEWVAWTPDGYYAASPGGERFIGWSVSNGANELATYYPAERFAKFFHRPDVLQKAFALGSLAEALISLETKPPEIEKVLPPSAKLEFVQQSPTGTVKVKATATSGAKDKPVLSMRVMLDGRPLALGKGLWTIEPGQPAEAVLELEVPPEMHELKLLAKSADGDAISDPLPVQGPKKPGTQMTIHRVCIGVNEYDDPGLKLGSPAKDAAAIFDAFARDCVGPYNRFGAAAGELILDKDATRGRVLAALKKVRDAAVPGDLVVVFFAGHGVMQKDAFYLLTREADLTKDLNGISVSGEELQAVLKDVECPVLLIMDACQSGGVLKSFRPAAPGLTRNLATNQTGVTVLSAAAELEEAEATAEGGHFTRGILKALKLAEGVPFEPYKRKLYVDHIYLVVASEVQRATGDRQNPTFKRPETAPFVAVRDVPVR